MENTKYTLIIGLEVHIELKTKSKMFCNCSADYFGKSPNTHTCPICLGLPGALPIPNRTAIDWCVMIALALGCKISTFSKFDRKNYFYPDLPKGFQISQYDMPFGVKGKMQLSSGKIIGITRVHMEEDTGKLTHNGGSSLIDFNRSGVPLVEIVTEPDFNSATDVKEYLQRLQQIVRYLDVSNADMEKGDMRLEPNISLAKLSLRGVPTGRDDEARYKTVLGEVISTGSSRDFMNMKSARDDNELPPYKVEVKNINSFRFVEKAIAYELTRQAEILDQGKTPLQETRGWNEHKQQTFSQRVKEEANDYRYFPEPDIPPIVFSEVEISKLRDSLPELPGKVFDRFVKEYNLSPYDAEILSRDKKIAAFFERTVQEGNEKHITPKQIANIIINKKIDETTTKPNDVIQIIMAATQTIQIDDSEFEKVISEVIAEQEKAVQDFKNGKESVIMFLVGQVMRKIGKKIDAQMVKERLEIILHGK